MNYYTNERNAQILIYTMKAHKIRKVIVSPGTTNVALVASLQIDSFFELYSAPDERSAAYMACGMAVEANEPVALSCTGATASRNYYPGLTEAFYRKIPILTITSSRRNDRIGHNFDQVTDRTQIANDIANISVQLPIVHDEEDEWACSIAANKALLALKRSGGGPVHINLETMYSSNFDIKELPKTRIIERYSYCDVLPEVSANNIAVVVGAHSRWSDKLEKAVESFCEKYNGIVICDQVSNYFGKYAIYPNIALAQRFYSSVVKKVDLVIHIGEITSSEYNLHSKCVWRVSPDGELRDTYWKLTKVFEMSEEYFFEWYLNNSQCVDSTNTEFYDASIAEEKELASLVQNIPFSNLWIAQYLSKLMPQNSVIHLGIRNSLRCWNYFKTTNQLPAFSNTGGFGIDGSISTVMGAALVNSDKVYYCILGDLAFFYDMNSLGNRHFPKNVRILLINNGTGMEMRFSSFYATKIGAEKNNYISASGHYGNKSADLVRNYANNLGIRYLAAHNQNEFIAQVDTFLDEKTEKGSIIFEVFIDDKNEDKAFEIISELKRENSQVVKRAVLEALGQDKINKIKKMIK